MSTLEGKKLYEVSEERVEKQLTRSSEVVETPSEASAPTPVLLHEKSKISIEKQDFGPCDTFDYNFKTNQFWYNLILKPLVAIMKFGWKVRIEGKENVPLERNFVLMPNHVSHFDSFLAGAFLGPKLAPIAIVDEKLFKNRYFGMFAKRLNGFPVRKGTKNMNIVKYAINRINSGDTLLWYPEGQRHKTPWINACNSGKLGSGMLAHSIEAPIVPCYVSGPEFAMPVGRRITWGMGPRSIEITVHFGKPVPLDDLRQLPASPEVSKLVVSRIIEKIEELRPPGPYKIHKTKKNQNYRDAKRLLFKSKKYVNDKDKK
ncbi:MAG: lysophospholipid acyltransferase family protein [Candidatus Kariarchaeaceae archaeon]